MDKNITNQNQPQNQNDPLPAVGQQKQSSPQTQQDGKKLKQKPVSVGGPEGQSVSVEQVGGKSVESAGENLRKVESGTEKKEKRTKPQKPKKVQQSKKANQKKKTFGKKEPEGPKVYGFKIPPRIGNNPHLVSKMKGKGDPKTGIACLYVFLDRLMKKHSKIMKG